MAKEQRNKRVKQREYACRSCCNMEERLKGQKEINFSGLEPGDFQKTPDWLIWHVDFLVFTHCVNLKRLSPCQRLGLLGLNSYLSMYRQGWCHRWDPSYCCITVSKRNIYSAKEGICGCVSASHQCLLLSNQGACQGMAAGQLQTDLKKNPKESLTPVVIP